MKKCVMCNKEFEEKELDFAGRCEPCFKAYVTAPDHLKPKLNLPYSPKLFYYSDGGTITMAHKKDIESRRLGPDGEVVKGNDSIHISR